MVREKVRWSLRLLAVPFLAGGVAIMALNPQLDDLKHVRLLGFIVVFVTLVLERLGEEALNHTRDAKSDKHGAY